MLTRGYFYLHVSRGLENFERSEHRALECHHLLGSDEMITPDIDNMTLQPFQWRAVIEQTLSQC